MSVAKCKFFSLVIILCTLICHYAEVSNGLLSVTTVDGAQRTPLNPNRITVGNSSDMIAEVRCSSSNESSTVTWLYEDGTPVPSGLTAFGTTQGDGILRIYPAYKLLSPSPGTRFQCRDAENDQILNVTLELQKTLSYMSFPIMYQITSTRELYDECRRKMPDLPTAEIIIVNETIPSTGMVIYYCRIETERGVLLSTTTNLTKALKFPVMYSNERGIFKYQEDINAVGNWITYYCFVQKNASGYWFQDGRNITSDYYRERLRVRASMNNTGFFQCVHSWNTAPERFFTTPYAIVYTSVEYLDTNSLAISPSSQFLTFTRGLDDTVSLNCSVRGSPILPLEWSKHHDPYYNIDAVQAPTGFNKTAFSILTINVTELGIGTHTFQCTATLNYLASYVRHIVQGRRVATLRTDSASVLVHIRIQQLLANISVVPEVDAYYFDPTNENDTNKIISVNCSVQVYHGVPRVEWKLSIHGRYGEINVTQYAEPLASYGKMHISILNYPLERLNYGISYLTCDVTSRSESIKSNATITKIEEPPPPPIHVETSSVAPSSTRVSTMILSTVAPTTLTDRKAMPSSSSEPLPISIIASLSTSAFTTAIATSTESLVIQPSSMITTLTDRKAMPSSSSEPLPISIIASLSTSAFTTAIATSTESLVIQPSSMITTLTDRKAMPSSSSEPLPISIIASLSTSAFTTAIATSTESLVIQPSSMITTLTDRKAMPSSSSEPLPISIIASLSTSAFTTAIATSTESLVIQPSSMITTLTDRKAMPSSSSEPLPISIIVSLSTSAFTTAIATSTESLVIQPSSMTSSLSISVVKTQLAVSRPSTSAVSLTTTEHEMPVVFPTPTLSAGKNDITTSSFNTPLSISSFTASFKVPKDEATTITVNPTTIAFISTDSILVIETDVTTSSTSTITSLTTSNTVVTLSVDWTDVAVRPIATTEPITPETKILVASNSDIDVIPIAIAGIATAMIVLIVVAILAVVMMLILAASRRRMETNLSSHSDIFKSVDALRNGLQNGVISTVINTSLVNVEAEPRLQNTPPAEDGDIHSPISVEAFPDHCRNMHENSDHPFSEEFQVLSIKSPNLPNAQASRSCNVSKNRYANVHCNDGTRVCLDYVSGVDGSDYIHANFIDGYLKKNAYIATQGPLSHTTYDFWRMVWEVNSPCIIMLTNLVEKTKTKCHPYWPELADGTLTLKDITISPVDVVQLAYYTIRSFKVSRGGAQPRLVKQFHYTGWPDFGVPDHPHPIIAFIRHIDNFVRLRKGPDIVHCSAGVGRTGTLIAIHSMMKIIEHERKVDVFNFVLGMRHQRNVMVQTERQYTFIHDTLLEVLEVGHTDIIVQNFPTCYKVLIGSVSDSTHSRMEEEFNYLNEIENVKESQFQAANKQENVPKNRSQAILPYDRHRVQLQPKLDNTDSADYINASHLDGYRQRQHYILAQGPLANTVDDFWRMVWEHNSYNIVMLCSLKEKGKEQCTQYWPNELKIIRKYDSIYVELIKITEYGHYTMRELSIVNTNTNEKRAVWQYQYSGWPKKQSPFNSTAFLKLCEALKESQRVSGGPIIAHDSTSVGRAGTFCVLSSVLEQLKVEGIVDLFFTIHSLRQQQPGLVQTFEQYKFCYDTILKYLESLDNQQ